MLGFAAVYKSSLLMSGLEGRKGQVPELSQARQKEGGVAREVDGHTEQQLEPPEKGDAF